MIFVSACLLGHKVKYNGGSNANELMMDFNFYGCFISGCAECSGRLPIPRPNMEIVGGTAEDVLSGAATVKNINGQDLTKNILSGCDVILRMIKTYNIKYAILKEGSPTCGVHEVHDGSFSRQKIPGCGVLTALLKRNGVKIYSEKDISSHLLEKLVAEEGH